jgi:hypothetical protein
MLMDEPAWLAFTAPASDTWMFESKSEEETDLALDSGRAVDDPTLLSCATRDRRALLAEPSAGRALPPPGRQRRRRREPSPHPRRARPDAPVRLLVEADGEGSSTTGPAIA